jgi:hypothetical protein
VAAAIAFAARAEAGRQSPLTWSEPVALSRDPSAQFPDVAGDRAGGLHVFWSAMRPGGNRMIGCRPLEDGCAATEEVTRPLRWGSHHPKRASAVVDDAGTLHLFWRADRELAHQARSVVDPESGWTRPQRLGSGSPFAIFGGPERILHVLSGQPLPADGRDDRCRGCGDVQYRRSEDGGRSWTPPRNLTGSPLSSVRVRLALGPEREIHAAWEEGLEDDSASGGSARVGVSASLDGGATWRSPMFFETSNSPPGSPVVAVDALGAVVLVYWQLDRVVYRRSRDAGRTWSAAERIEGLWQQRTATAFRDGIDLGRDGAGEIHLLLAGRPAEDSTVNGIYHVAWDGRAWSQPEEVHHTARFPEWPRLAVTEGNRLHAVWLERIPPSGDEPARSELRWSTAESRAAHEPPVAYAPPTRAWFSVDTAAPVLQSVAAVLIVGGVILWARRRGL